MAKNPTSRVVKKPSDGGISKGWYECTARCQYKGKVMEIGDLVEVVDPKSQQLPTIGSNRPDLGRVGDIRHFKYCNPQPGKSTVNKVIEKAKE